MVSSFGRRYEVAKKVIRLKVIIIITTLAIFHMFSLFLLNSPLKYKFFIYLEQEEAAGTVKMTFYCHLTRDLLLLY